MYALMVLLKELAVRCSTGIGFGWNPVDRVGAGEIAGRRGSERKCVFPVMCAGFVFESGLCLGFCLPFRVFS